ncbi:MAG: MFS transporter [Bacteroidales bacterium]|nr:MFS transporter [Bacteroidales bacterium]
MPSTFKKDLQYYKFCLYGFLKNQKFYEPFFLLFLLSKDISYLQVGILYSIKEITVNLLEIPAGMIADSAGRRKSMLLSFTLYIISFIVFYLSSGYTILIIAIIIFGMADVFRTGTHKAMIFSYLEANNWSHLKVDYYGHTRSCSQLGSALSSLIAAAIVIITKNYSMVFAFAIIPYILNLINLATYPSWLDGEQKKFDARLFRRNIKTTLMSLVTAFRDKWTIRIFINSSLPSGYFNSVKDYLQPLILSLVAALPVLGSFAQEDKGSVLIGLIYFFIFILTSRASRGAGSFSRKTGSIFSGMNITFLIVATAGILTGLLFHTGILIVSVLFFVLLYLLENLRRPVCVAGIAERLGDESLSTFLSTDSQLKSLFTMILSPVVGLLADLVSPGAGVMIAAAIILIAYPFVRIRESKVEGVEEVEKG